MAPQRWSTWKKSSFTAQGGNECVEAAPWGEVRDSKNPGVTITIPTASWLQFISTLRADKPGP